MYILEWDIYVCHRVKFDCASLESQRTRNQLKAQDIHKRKLLMYLESEYSIQTSCVPAPNTPGYDTSRFPSPERKRLIGSLMTMSDTRLCIRNGNTWWQIVVFVRMMMVVMVVMMCECKEIAVTRKS